MSVLIWYILNWKTYGRKTLWRNLEHVEDFLAGTKKFIVRKCLL